MSILVNKNTRILVQGITGTQASFHVRRSIEGGTNIVGGTSLNSGISEHLGVPVFPSIYEARRQLQFNASIMFVPATSVKSAVREAVEAQIGLIISIAQGIPVHDMLEIKSMLKGSQTMMIGPNTPGIITPQEARLGIFPDNIHHKGCIGIISRASTLTYEAVLETNAAGLGQSTVIGLGDDLIIGTDFRPLLQKFMQDPETKAVILLGKANSTYEQLAAEYYRQIEQKKPVIAYIAGESLPYGYVMGYASDIVTHGRITVADKKKILKDAGMIVVDEMTQIHSVLTDLNLK